MELGWVLCFILIECAVVIRRSRPFVSVVVRVLRAYVRATYAAWVFLVSSCCVELLYGPFLDSVYTTVVRC